MKIALIQSDIHWNDPTKNVAHLEKLSEQALNAGARLLVFPEMCTTGFSFLSGRLAQEAAEIGSTFLQELANRSNVYTCGSLPFTADADYARPKNTLRVFGPAGNLGDYSKIHLFSFGGEPEKYRAGDHTLTLEIEGFRISFFICYDLRFPMVFSALAPQTDMYVVVANWPAPRRAHWMALLMARAIENQAYVVGVNRVGEGGGLSYVGDSRVISPTGEIVAEADSKEGVLVSEVDLAAVGAYRKSFTCLADRRQDIRPIMPQ